MRKYASLSAEYLSTLADKFNTMMKMVEDFQRRGVPISGIGFQMHIRMDIPNEIIAYTLKRAADTGLQIHLSEVDLIFNTHDDSKGGGIQRYSTITKEMLNQAKLAIVFFIISALCFLSIFAYFGFNIYAKTNANNFNFVYKVH